MSYVFDHKASHKMDYCFKFAQAYLNLKAFLRLKKRMYESLRQPLSNIMPIARIDNFDPIAAFHSSKITCNDICTFIENKITSLHHQYEETPKTNINPWTLSGSMLNSSMTNPYHMQAAANYNLASSLTTSSYMQAPVFSHHEMEKLFTSAEWSSDYECLNCCWEMKECYLALENLDKKYDTDNHVEYKEAIDKTELAFKKLKLNIDSIELPADMIDLWKGYNLFKMLKCYITRGM